MKSMFLLSLLFALNSLTNPVSARDAENTEPAIARVEKGNLVLEGIPEIPPEVAARFGQYQNARYAFLRGWHPSGEGILISTRFGETDQVHWVRSPGGTRHQVTFFDEPVGDVAVSPDPELNGFVFDKDAGGGEFFQVSFFDMKTGTHRMLSDGKSLHGGISVSNRGDRVAYYSTQRNGRDWDVHVAGLKGTAPPRAVLEKGGYWEPAGWSPDDRRLLVVRMVSANERHPYVLDLESGELTAIMTTEEQVAYGAVTWSHDGNMVYFSSDAGSEFLHLRVFDVETGDVRVLSADVPWNVKDVRVSHDGRWLAFTVNAGGIGKLHLWQAEGESWKEAALPELPVGQILRLRFSPDSGHLALVLNTAQTMGDVYMIELDTARLERWTYSEIGGLDTSGFTLPELVHYETFDEVDGKPRRIPAFYYKPPGEGPWPVLIDIHGGPEFQHRPYFIPQIRYFLEELGIAVLAPNVRGSAGYGKSYLKLDNGMKREDAVRDLGKLLDWIETRPELDAERVAVLGSSYGGYMVLAALTHFNDRLRGGVDIVGISNFVTFLENTQEYRRDFRRVEYGDERDPEMRAFLERISPTTNAHKITKPLFIAQGLNDPRVPVSEAEQILAAVRDNGGEPWYFLAKDEGHGFRKKSNFDHFTNAVSLFLEKVLLDRH